MAISGGDGSIILTTKVDEAGLKKGLVSLKRLGATAGKAFLAIGAAAATATVAITKMAVSAYADYEQLVGGVETLFKDSAGKVLEYANQAFATTGQSANEYMQNVTAFSASLLSAVGGDTEKAADIANAAMVSISDNVNKMGSSAESVQLAFQGFAKQQYMLLDNLKLGYGGTKTEMERLLKDAEAWNREQGKIVDYSIDNLADVYTAIGDIQEKLDIAGTTAKEAESTISGSAAMMKAAWQNLLTAMAGGGDLNRAINNFVYSLEKFTANIVPVIERTLLGLGQAIQRTLPMLVQTVVSALVQQIPNLVMAVYNMILGLFKGIVLGIKALFTGGTAKATEVIKGNVSGISNSASSAADNLNDVAGATKQAGAEAKKAAAAFDDLNILSSGASSSSGDSGGSGDVSIPTVDVGDATAGDGGGLLQGALGDLEQEIDATLVAIMGIAGLSLVAIGLMLLFFGNIAWGIGFIIAGAVTFDVAAGLSAKYDVATEVIGVLTTIMAIAGGALLALGIILLWLGGVVGKGVAIGMIIAGAALIVGAIATKAAFKPKDIKGWLSLILGIAAGALLALGVILCMVGSIPLGVGLIIAGVVSLVSAVALNYEEVTNKITGWVAVIMAIAGASLLVLGIVLCVAGVSLPLGIALIAVGAIALVTPIVLNWNKIKENFKKFITDNMGLIIGIASALLVLGIILCITGVALPIGIALIVVGAGILVSEVVLNWDKIKTSINSFIKDNCGLIMGVAYALLVLGIVLCITGVALPIGIALIVVGAGILVSEVVLNWDKIKEQTIEVFTKIYDWIKTWGLLVLGIILCITGVAIPLGIALIAKGGANLTEAQNPLWTAIVDKVKEIWEKIKSFWNQNIAPIFTTGWWKALAKKAGNGLISGFESAVNSIITLFERMINYVVSGLNKISLTIPDWVPEIGGKKFGVNLRGVSLGRVSIPRLAQGTVIPPNHEFLAVLGDQKSGTNIEAPLDTIVEAMNIALQNNSAGQTTKEEHYYLNETEMMRIVYKLFKGGERLNGESLITGGVY